MTDDNRSESTMLLITEMFYQLERERDGARKQNSKLRDIAERAIHYLSQSYRNGFEDEVKELQAELDQLKEETK